MNSRIGRNDPCSCGSGRKYKQCCLLKSSNRASTSLEPRSQPPTVTPYVNYMERALAAYQVGALSLAVEHYQKALVHSPRSPAAHTNLANVLLQLGDVEAAISNFTEALAIEPQLLAAHCGLGTACKARREFTRAVLHFEKALQIDPKCLAAHVNLSTLYLSSGQPSSAEKHARKALSLAPGTGEIYGNLANILRVSGELDLSMEANQQAIKLKPDDLDQVSNLLFTMAIHPNVDKQAYLAQARLYGAKASGRATPYVYDRRYYLERSTAPLKVGLVSGDFRSHPVGYFLENVLACVDPQAIALHAYTTQPLEDAYTQKLRTHLRGWTSLHNVRDSEAAARIHADGIDVLIDLAGHTGNNRLPVFAYRCAPVQISWLGYFASTGLPTMHFILGDAHATPAPHDQEFCERVLNFSATRLCFSAPTAPGVASTPALERGYVTFGCVQNTSKINKPILACWTKILSRVPNSRLLLRGTTKKDSTERARWCQRLADSGIDAARVDLADNLPRAEYLAAYGEIDILLDTYPFTGGTTTCEAIYMGVPTVTRCGQTMLSRQGAGLLSQVGLHDWIAHTEEEYVGIAVAAANDIDSLQTLRLSLRDRAANSTLFDGTGFARELESLIQQAWQQFVDGSLD